MEIAGRFKITPVSDSTSLSWNILIPFLLLRKISFSREPASSYWVQILKAGISNKRLEVWTSSIYVNKVLNAKANYGSSWMSASCHLNIQWMSLIRAWPLSCGIYRILSRNLLDSWNCGLSIPQGIEKFCGFAVNAPDAFQNTWQ